MISAVIRYDDNKVSIHSSKTKMVGTKFEKGFYKAYTDNDGHVRISYEIINEMNHLYDTEDNILIKNAVDGFFDDSIYDNVRKLKFTHKLGILLYGKQGTGKTSCLNYIANIVVEKYNGIVFICNDENHFNTAISLAKSIREIQKEPICFISDEFERFAIDAESKIKNVTDGNESIDKSLFLCATNYINKVPETIKNRPSRFKVKIEMKGIKDKVLIKSILTDMSNKLKPNLFTPTEIDDLVSKKNEYTLDEIKHLALDKITGCYIPDNLINKPIGFNSNRTDDNVVKNPSSIKKRGFTEDMSLKRKNKINSTI